MRLSLSEVLSNPWFTDPDTPTAETIRAHFNAVRTAVELKAQENLNQDIIKYNESQN